MHYILEGFAHPFDTLRQEYAPIIVSYFDSDWLYLIQLHRRCSRIHWDHCISAGWGEEWIISQSLRLIILFNSSAGYRQLLLPTWPLSHKQRIIAVAVPLVVPLLSTRYLRLRSRSCSVSISLAGAVLILYITAIILHLPFDGPWASRIGLDLLSGMSFCCSCMFPI